MAFLSGVHCSLPVGTVNCVATLKAKGSYDWARSDRRIVGLNPWHYNAGTATGANRPGGPFEPGLAGMPAVLAAYGPRVSTEIYTRRCH